MSYSTAGDFAARQLKLGEFHEKLEQVVRRRSKEPHEDLYVSVTYSDGISRSKHKASFADLDLVAAPDTKGAFLELRWKNRDGAICDLTMSLSADNWYIAVDCATAEEVRQLYDNLAHVFQLKPRRLAGLPSADSPTKEAVVSKFIEEAVRKLRKLIRTEPKSERAVQDSFEDFLNATDTPYEREICEIKYSAKSFKPDFTLAQFDLAVELKLCTSADRLKSIVEDINADFPAYLSKFKHAFFLVYDLGHIRDVDEFCRSFERTPGVRVRIIKH